MISLPRCIFVLMSARNQVTVRPRLTLLLHLVQKNNTLSDFLTTCLDFILKKKHLNVGQDTHYPECLIF
jgi:hypothetical protein